MAEETHSLQAALRGIIALFDRAAEGRAESPKIYLVGAGSLVLDGLSARPTRDLDFICDQEGEIFENQILPNGLHSHRVPSGLVSMPAGWRERSREATEFKTKNIKVYVPDIHDRMVDKIARGLATDWEDIASVLTASPSGFSAGVLAERASALLRSPTSTVFEPARFRRNFERLRGLASESALTVPPLSP